MANFPPKLIHVPIVSCVESFGKSSNRTALIKQLENAAAKELPMSKRRVIFGMSRKETTAENVSRTLFIRLFAKRLPGSVAAPNDVPLYATPTRKNTVEQSIERRIISGSLPSSIIELSGSETNETMKYELALTVFHVYDLLAESFFEVRRDFRICLFLENLKRLKALRYFST